MKLLATIKMASQFKGRFANGHRHLCPHLYLPRHPASFNFGDCFVYALAKIRGEALLFKGNDFSKTDLLSSLI